ncbi:MAG: hypothetical protein IJN42_01400 [Clostridia bacterium]|nr:hypothetical protein [Clostridia bacterium]
MKTGKIRCKIADLIVDVPEALAWRCADYRFDGAGAADIEILEERYREELYADVGAPRDIVEYQESGRQFSYFLIKYDGIYLHASAVEYEGMAYLFSAPCGTGKSTHTKLWEQHFAGAQVFNDDKPALRRLEGKWYAYGTPWCGKDGINQNRKVPIAGICFLHQAPENRIRRLSNREAVAQILPQTMHRFKRRDRLEQMLTLLDQLVREIPVYDLECRPDKAAAELSLQTMRPTDEEK